MARMTSVEATVAGAEPIAVLGGTFDPIHHGHLLIAEHAREALGVSRVLFIPSARPPHKLDEPVTPARDRLHMTLLGTAGNPRFHVSARELERAGPSYSITTIRELKAEGHAEVFFLIGADSALELHTWWEPEAILREATVAVVPRPGFDMRRVGETLGKDRAGRLLMLKAPCMDISSTEIRARVAAGQSITYLVPPAVEDYIMKRQLYRGATDPARL